MLRTYEIGLNQEQNVLIDFKQLIRHAIFEPREALELAALLTKHAKQSTKYTAGN
jgi:hypothetical protein